MAFAGDSTATLDVSRQSISIKRHRSRRQRRQRRNVIGFSQSLQMDEDSSDDDDEDFEPEHLDREATAEPSLSISVTSTSIAGEEDFFARMERMSSELDSLVRFIRRGVESLAGGTSEAASAFGVLASAAAASPSSVASFFAGLTVYFSGYAGTTLVGQLRLGRTPVMC